MVIGHIKSFRFHEVCQEKGLWVRVPLNVDVPMCQGSNWASHQFSIMFLMNADPIPPVLLIILFQHGRV